MKTSARTDLILTLIMTALTGTLVLLYSQLQPQDSTNKPGIPDFDNSIQAWLPAENVPCWHNGEWTTNMGLFWFSRDLYLTNDYSTNTLSVPQQVQLVPKSSKPPSGDSPTLSSPNSGAR